MFQCSRGVHYNRPAPGRGSKFVSFSALARVRVFFDISSANSRRWIVVLSSPGRVLQMRRFGGAVDSSGVPWVETQGEDLPHGGVEEEQALVDLDVFGLRP